MVNATTMKKLFTLVSSTLLLIIYGNVFSQPEDPALVSRIGDQSEVKSGEAKNISETSGTKEVENATVEIAPVNFESFKMIERTRSEKKVGPQGEDLLIEGNRFFYLNDKGKKVKVRKNELKAMPKHS